MELEKFLELKVGDYVRIENLSEASDSYGVNSLMKKYSGAVAKILSITKKDWDDGMYTHYLRLDIDNNSWSWFPHLIKERLSEKEVEELLEKRKIKDTLCVFDKVRIADYETLADHYGAWSSISDYADRIFTIRNIQSSDIGEKLYQMEETSAFFKAEDIAEIIEKFEWSNVKPLEMDKNHTVEELDIENNYVIQHLGFCEITNDIKKIVDKGNSLKFAKIIAGKYLIIDTETHRISDYNKHIYGHCIDFRCSGWRIDYLNDLIVGEIVQPFASYDKRFIKLKVDFENKTFEQLKINEDEYCQNCGRPFRYYTKCGKYCSGCLDEYTTRYGYHEFCGEYTIYENVDTTRTPVFGTENERDYIEEDFDRGDEWNEYDRDEYISSYTWDDAYEDEGITDEEWEADEEECRSRIDERLDEIRNQRAEEYDETHYTPDEDGDFECDMQHAIEEAFKELQGDQIEDGTLRRENVFMYDGSLNHGGVEWITFPHTFKWYLQNKSKIQRALDAFDSYGFRDSEATGNHIHINKDYFTINGVDYGDFCASKIAVLFNKYWEQFCKIANRYNTSYTNKPAQSPTDTPEQIVRKTANSKGDHCVAVNLQHSKTVEIRLWAGIRSADELIFFLDNMQALARYVKGTSLEKIQIAKMTDFMKLYKLDSSLEEAKYRINCLYDNESKAIVKDIEKIIEKRNNKKEGK